MYLVICIEFDSGETNLLHHMQAIMLLLTKVSLLLIAGCADSDAENSLHCILTS